MVRWRTTGLAWGLVVLALLGLAAQGQAEEPIAGDRVVVGRVLVKPRSGLEARGLLSTLATQEVHLVASLPQLGYIVLSVPPGKEGEWVQRLASSPLVEHAQPEFVYSVLREPNDWFFNLYKGDGIPYQWNLRTINAPAAWDITTGSSDIIAIVDTGVDDRHEDLSGKVVLKTDYINEDNLFDGLGGHGTLMSGIAAAKTNNGNGIAAVSWGARIMSVKVANHFGKAKESDAVQGIVYAADNGAKILNLSFGAEGVDSPLLQDAVNYAYNRGILVVAAAGNCADPAKFIQYDCKTFNAPFYPAAGQNVLAVGAVNDQLQRSTFSEYGSYVAVVAPGEDILSTLPNQGYGRYSGTSMAAPHVSALASLIWSVNPSLTNAQVANIITSTAVNLGPPGKDDEYGYGLIDANTALLKASLSLLPTELGFLTAVTETRTLTRTLTVSSLTSPLSWSASVDPGTSWLSVNPTSGTTPATITVSMNRGSLGIGRYESNVTVQVSGLERARQAIPAALVLAEQIRNIFLPAAMRAIAAGW